MPPTQLPTDGPGVTGIPPRQAGATHLQQIIAQLTEGVVLVEPDGTLSWADETALALHGARTLAELGGTVAGYGKRFQLAYRGGEPIAAEATPAAAAAARADHRPRHGRGHPAVRPQALGARDPHHGADRRAGRPDSLVLILNDETERFNAEERFERAFAANPAPAIIVRLSDMRYVKVNPGSSS